MQSDHLEAIHQLFGQIPDVLEYVWVQVAQDKIEEAKQTISAVLQKHPFDFKYHQIKKVNWESCATVLSASDH